MNEKTIIGRKDFADFPGLGIEKIAVKIDTGAYTSAIHCHHIEEKEIDGKMYICFELLDPEHLNYNNRQFKIQEYRQKRIKSSTGHIQKRFIIKTTIILFNTEYPIDLSLSERSGMKYPVLLGRKLLKHNFIIDPSKSNLSNKKKREQTKQSKHTQQQ